MGTGLNRLIDMKDLAVFADVVSPSKWKRAIFVHNSKCFCRFFAGIA